MSIPISLTVPSPILPLVSISSFSRSMSLFLKQVYSWFIQHPELVENSMTHSINMLVSFWSLSLPAGMLKWSFCLTIASYYEEPAHTCLPAEWVQNNSVRRYCCETSQVVQQLRRHLPMQGKQIRSLVGKLGSHSPHVQRTKNIKTEVISLTKSIICFVETSPSKLLSCPKRIG